VDYFQEVANLKNIIISVKITPNILYFFSKVKLQRIVDNTISNAIKYSYDKKNIEVMVTKDDENIHFSVKDYGVGIENVKKIFFRYYREDETKGGFGIGLNIVKDIIDEENIHLEIQSKLKKGTTFNYSFRNIK
jgi:signal transduction histidine kinase